MAHIDGPVEAFGVQWAPQIGAFVAHWKTLRAGAIMPTSAHFLDNPAAPFATNSYIAELTSEGAIVRYQGSDLVERWMRDFTGVELHQGRNPVFKAHSLSNMTCVANQPCGYLLQLSFSTSTGRKMGADLVQLPLSVKPGKPRRIVCFTQPNLEREWQETIAKYLETHRGEWIDLGAGVPDAPPQALLQDA